MGDNGVLRGLCAGPSAMQGLPRLDMSLHPIDRNWAHADGILTTCKREVQQELDYNASIATPAPTAGNDTSAFSTAFITTVCIASPWDLLGVEAGNLAVLYTAQNDPTPWARIGQSYVLYAILFATLAGICCLFLILYLASRCLHCVLSDPDDDDEDDRSFDERHAASRVPAMLDFGLANGEDGAVEEPLGPSLSASAPPHNGAAAPPSLTTTERLDSTANDQGTDEAAPRVNTAPPPAAPLISVTSFIHSPTNVSRSMEAAPRSNLTRASSFVRSPAANHKRSASAVTPRPAPLASVTSFIHTPEPAIDDGDDDADDDDDDGPAARARSASATAAPRAPLSSVRSFMRSPAAGHRRSASAVAPRRPGLASATSFIHSSADDEELVFAGAVTTADHRRSKSAHPAPLVSATSFIHTPARDEASLRARSASALGTPRGGLLALGTITSHQRVPSAVTPEETLSEGDGTAESASDGKPASDEAPAVGSRFALAAYAVGFFIMGLFILVFLTMIILGDKQGFESFVEAQKHLIVSMPNGTAELVRGVPSIVRAALATVGGRSTATALQVFNSSLDLPEVSRAFSCLDAMVEVMASNESARAVVFIRNLQTVLYGNRTQTLEAIEIVQSQQVLFEEMPGDFVRTSLGAEDTALLDRVLRDLTTASVVETGNVTSALKAYIATESAHGEVLASLADFRAQLAALPLASSTDLRTDVQALAEFLAGYLRQVPDDALLRSWRQSAQTLDLSALRSVLLVFSSLLGSVSLNSALLTSNQEWHAVNATCAQASVNVEIIVGTNATSAVNMDALIFLLDSIHSLRGRVERLADTAVMIELLSPVRTDHLASLDALETLCADMRTRILDLESVLNATALAAYGDALANLANALDLATSEAEACADGDACASSRAESAVDTIARFVDTRQAALREVLHVVHEARAWSLGEWKTMAEAANAALDERRAVVGELEALDLARLATDLAQMERDLAICLAALLEIRLALAQDADFQSDLADTSAIMASMSDFVTTDLAAYMSDLREDELLRSIDTEGFAPTITQWADTLDDIFAHFMDLVGPPADGGVDDSMYEEEQEEQELDTWRMLLGAENLGYAGNLVRNTSAFLDALEAAADRDDSEQALPRGGWFYLLSIANQLVPLPSQWTNISMFEAHRNLRPSALLTLEGLADPTSGAIVKRYTDDALCFMDECLLNTIDVYNRHAVVAGLPSPQQVYLVLFAFPMILVGFAFLALCCSALGNRLTAPFVVTGCLVAPVMFGVVAVGVPVLLILGDFCNFVEPALLANVRNMESVLCEQLGMDTRLAAGGYTFCSANVLGDIRIDLDLDQTLQSALISCSGSSVANVAASSALWGQRAPQEPIAQLWAHLADSTGPLLAEMLWPYLGDGNETVLMGITFDMTAEEILAEVVSNSERIIRDVSLVFDCEAFAFMFETIKEPICCELTDTVFWLVAPWLTFAVSLLFTVGPALCCVERYRPRPVSNIGTAARSSAAFYFTVNPLLEAGRQEAAIKSKTSPAGSRQSHGQPDEPTPARDALWAGGLRRPASYSQLLLAEVLARLRLQAAATPARPEERPGNPASPC